MEANLKELHEKAVVTVTEGLMDDDVKGYLRAALIRVLNVETGIAPSPALASVLKPVKKEKITIVPIEEILEELETFSKDNHVMENYPATRLYVINVLKMCRVLKESWNLPELFDFEEMKKQGPEHDGPPKSEID
jgi:hypothetical protein